MVGVLYIFRGCFMIILCLLEGEIITAAFVNQKNKYANDLLQLKNDQLGHYDRPPFLQNNMAFVLLSFMLSRSRLWGSCFHITHQISGVKSCGIWRDHSLEFGLLSPNLLLQPNLHPLVLSREPELTCCDAGEFMLLRSTNHQTNIHEGLVA